MLKPLLRHTKAHVVRLLWMFEEAMEAVPAPCLTPEQYDHFLELRDQTMHLMNELGRNLVVEIVHGVKLPISSGPRHFYRASEGTNARCVLCREERLVQVCHVIPASEGGFVTEENVIHLCLWHHVLFDDGLLSEHEFKGLRRALKKRPEEIRRYLEVRHEQINRKRQ